MSEIFQIRITDKIEITSIYNFDKNLEVIIYNENMNISYRTFFPFVKNITYWIAIGQLKNIIINILDENTLIFRYKDLKDDFAYITCGDLYYMDIIEKLVISLLNVSNKKIIVYGVNCKIPFDYPNLIKREYISPYFSPHDKWFWKQECCIEVLKENFDNYVWVDGDIIANFNIDNISQYFNQIENYPIGEIHVHDEQVITSSNGETQLMGEHICNHFGYNRKVLRKDLHACFFIFNERCKWFFEEIIETYHLIYEQGLYDRLLAWNDETLHNFMHSKYIFTKSLPLSNIALLCNHSKYESNPKILRLFYGYWYEDSPNNFGERWGWSYVPEDKNQILYFHENKNLKDADEMIEFIKMKKNNSFNSSKWFFINKYKIQNFEKERLNEELCQKYDECKLFEYKELLTIRPNDIVIDIGADIGFFERYCYLKNASKIICFEPNVEKFEILKLNAHKDTILFNADVTDNVGEYIVEGEIKDEIVNTYSINYLFDAELIDKIDLLKIDSKNCIEVLESISDINFKKINKISTKLELITDNIRDITKHGFNLAFYSLSNSNYLYFYR